MLLEAQWNVTAGSASALVVGEKPNTAPWLEIDVLCRFAGTVFDGVAPYSLRHVDSLQDQIRHMVERRPISFRHTEENAMSETDRLIEMVKYFAMNDKNTCWPAPTR